MTRILWLTAGFFLALALPVLAQGPHAPGRGHGIGGTVPEGTRPERTAPPVARQATPTTVAGQVESLTIQPGPGGRGMMQTAVLKTKEGSITVLLGPVPYLRQQNFPLQAGDSWEVSGFKTSLDTKPVVAAREVKKGTQVLKLRDDKGQPLWGGMRPKQ